MNGLEEKSSPVSGLSRPSPQIVLLPKPPLPSMGRCTEQPGSTVPEPAATKKPPLNVTQTYEQLSDSDPPDPPLPPGHYRKPHSKLKNAWYYVDTSSEPGRASWNDPRRSGRGAPPPNAFAAVWKCPLLHLAQPSVCELQAEKMIERVCEALRPPSNGRTMVVHVAHTISACVL